MWLDIEFHTRQWSRGPSLITVPGLERQCRESRAKRQDGSRRRQGATEEAAVDSVTAGEQSFTRKDGSQSEEEGCVYRKRGSCHLAACGKNRPPNPFHKGSSHLSFQSPVEIWLQRRCWSSDESACVSGALRVLLKLQRRCRWSTPQMQFAGLLPWK